MKGKKADSRRHLIFCKKVDINIFCSLFIVCCLMLTFISCAPRNERTFKKSRILMDTLVTITVVSNSTESADKAIDASFSEIEYLEKLLNFFSPDSEITRINKNAGISETKVSPDTLELLMKALYVSEKTEGAFDVTVGPVVRLYNFYQKIKPEDAAIKQNLPLVNYRDLIIDQNNSTCFLRKKGMLIDPGGITKGYAADKAVETLKKQGIRSGIVSVAGEIKTFGLKPDGKPWKIGIRNPRGKTSEDDIMATIELNDMAISTSGDYERCFLLDGIRYHHLLDPATGRPGNRCRSVSIITKQGTFTDAFATGVFILGPDRGMKVLENLGFDGIIIDSLGKIHMTPGIRGKVEFKKSV